MKADDIAFIVPDKEGVHVLYLKDGRIVTITTYNGHVTHVARLPDEDAIKKAAEGSGKHAAVRPYAI